MSEPIVKKTKSQKNKPLEFSCRRPVAVPAPQRKGLVKRVEEAPMDPRFNKDVPGEFDAKKFGTSYSFLNEYRADEMKQLKSRLGSKRTSYEEKEEIELTLKRMASQEQARARMALETNIRDELRQKEKELVATTGKKPYFHPRSAIKKLISERNEDSLRKSGKLQQFKAKQEQRSAAKERVNIPRTRRVVEVLSS
jgi:ribosomal RNA-processing protein 36